MADGPARQRPLSDFVSAQGSQSVFLPPFPDYFGWTSPAPGVKTPASSYVGGNGGSCDYAGLWNQWLIDHDLPDYGTSFSGSVSERSLSDGRVLITVDLHTTNALAWGMRITTPDFGDFAVDPVIFGARLVDILDGATPAIGECHCHFAWKQSPGDLVDLLHVEDPNFEFVDLSFRANASGPLTAAAGLGPDGTPGRMIISQTGTFRTRFMGATADAFPAEYVEIRKVGN